MRDTVSYASITSPLGTLWLAGTPRGLVRVSFFSDEDGFCSELASAFGTEPVWNPDNMAPFTLQLEQYFSGQRTVFDFPIDLSRCSPFQRTVLEAVAEVPYGEVQSYGDIARAIGNPFAARAVGGVMAANPVSIVIPCHRIVRSDGKYGEYALRSVGSAGASYKTMLLSLEGYQRGLGGEFADR